MISTHFFHKRRSIWKLWTQIWRWLHLFNRWIKSAKWIPHYQKYIRINFKKTLKNFLNNNLYYEPFWKIDSFFNGTGELLSETMPAYISSKFKYFPVTLVDVELSFPTCKCILSDRGHSFPIENLIFFYNIMLHISILFMRIFNISHVYLYAYVKFFMLLIIP